MLNDPFIVRIIGALFILAACLFGWLWWRGCKNHLKDVSSFVVGELFYGFSFVPVFLFIIGSCLLYFGRFV